MTTADPGRREDEPEYNDIFERFVGPIDSEDINELEGFIAYGFYKRAKREWAARIRERESRGPTSSELEQYVQTWTDSQMESARSRAERVLAEFAYTIAQNEEPKILRRALKGRFWQGVFQSVIGAILYTLILIVIAIILQYSGVDLFNILQNVAPET